MRLEPDLSLLCVVDIQERLLAAIPAAAQVVERSMRLARGAGLLGVPRLLVEQYPKGLGSTPAMLAAELPPAVAKMTFSCVGCEAVTAALAPEIASVVLCGLESHVCISQTALDLLARGLNVFIAVDAVSSRHAIDHETALARLQSSGAILTTTEAVLFEWCRSAEHPRFQAVRKLVL